MFGFVEVKGKSVLHQLWVNPLGQSQYRPVPMVELDAANRAACVTGYLPDDDPAPGAVNWHPDD